MRRLKAAVIDETGSTLPLVIFFCFLGLAVILAVTAATSLYLERVRLFTLADGAALAAAEAFDLGSLRASGEAIVPTLTDQDVAAAASAYLTDAPHPQLEALRVDRAVTIDGRGATVQLSAWWRPPVLTLFLPNGLRLDAESTARSVFR